MQFLSPRKASITQVCQWVLKAWDSILKEVIVKSSKKTGISNALDRADDDAIYESDGKSQLVMTFWISLEKLLLMRVRRTSQTKMMLLTFIWRTVMTSLLGFTINKA